MAMGSDPTVKLAETDSVDGWTTSTVSLLDCPTNTSSVAGSYASPSGPSGTVMFATTWASVLVVWAYAVTLSLASLET
jgi:hypothetical protein